MPTSWLDLLRWTLSSLLLCPESTSSVRVPSPTLCPLLSPTNFLFASLYLFRPRRDFKSKNPLSGFAPKQTKESSAWRATYIVLHERYYLIPYNSVGYMVRLLVGFQSQLQVSYMSSHTEELWYNETVCLWMKIYLINMYKENLALNSLPWLI